MSNIVGTRRFAAIDIGTVTCRLLIADVDKEGLHELERGYGITHLGEGVDARGYLKPEAMLRVARQIKLFQATVESYKTPDHPYITVVAMATSAARDAKNAEDFHALLAGLGVKLTIISGEKEAALSFVGASHDFRNENLLLVDVGGGSTELIAGRSGALPVFCHSFDLGCRRLTERYLLNDPPREEELEQARHWVFESLRGSFEKAVALPAGKGTTAPAPLAGDEGDKSSGSPIPLVSRENESSPCSASTSTHFAVERMVAVAGTATSLVSMHKRMVVYDSTQVHGSVISRDTLKEFYDSLRIIPLEKRRQTRGLDPDRANVIVAGLLILDTVMEICKQGFFTVSESDILQGIILDTATK